MNQDDDDLIQLLTGGRPGSTTVDTMWKELAPSVLPQSGWQVLLRRLAPWGLLPVAAAAGLLVFVGGREGTLKERGEEEVPTLRATCGDATAPCRAGVPFALEAAHTPKLEELYVFGSTEAGLPLIVGPVALSGSGPTALPVKLTPEPEDAEKGVVELWYVHVDPGVPSAQARQLVSEAGKRLRLRVLP